MDIQKRIEELALTLPECPAPLAAYVPATRFGDTIVVSGQLPSVKAWLLPVSHRQGYALAGGYPLRTRLSFLRDLRVEAFARQPLG